jgi:DDE superfamily endonuclease
MWCIGTITGEYLANREDVLDAYNAPAAAAVVRLCFDERPCQLLDHVLTPIPPKPNATQKEHQEYVRKGVCNVLLAYTIDTGQRHLQVTTTKNKGDYARFMDWLVQTYYPEAAQIKRVQDNYSTHTYGAFYEHLPVETARQLRHTLEFHYTPKLRLLAQHGRNRIRRPFPPVPGPAHRHPATTRTGSVGLASQAQRRRHQSPLVLHDRKSPR